MSSSHYLAHTEPIFKAENILELEDIHKLHCLKLFYRIVNGSLPAEISQLFELDPADPTRLLYFSCDDSSGKKRIRYTLPHFINNAPSAIKLLAYSSSPDTFKIKVKTFFIRNYDDSPCVRTNCYACNSNFHPGWIFSYLLQLRL